MIRQLSVVAILFLFVNFIILSCRKESARENKIEDNKPPVANAGADTIVLLPLNSVTLDGSSSNDQDGTINEFLWTQISGPALSAIDNSKSAKTTAKNLIKGVYQFELTVTDDGGLSAKDILMVIVDSAGTDGSNSCNIETRSVIQARLVPVGRLSIGRINIATAATNNKILFAGGGSYIIDSTGIPMRRIDIYDINNNTWSIKDLPDDPQWRADMGIATVGNKVLIAGGGFWGDDIYTDRVDIYNSSEDSWSSASLSQSRSSIAAVTAANKVFFAGGYGWFEYRTDHWSNMVDIYDNSTNTWTTSTLSEARGFVSAVNAGNKIYFAGGERNNGQFFPSDRIDEYDLLSNKWSTSSLKEARSGMGVISAGNKVFFAGGQTKSGESGTVEIRDVVTGATSLACIIPRAGLNAVLKDDKIVFFTGYGTDARNSNHFEIYNLATDDWYTAVLDKSITNAAIISVNNVIYVAGGFVNGTGSDQVWKLEF